MRIRNRDDDGPGVDMTPMIDCVFLLLIFFLVATVMKKIERELPIQLPDSTAAMATPRDDQQLVVGIDVDGRYYLDGSPATTEGLHARLREVAALDRQYRIRVDCDRDARMQQFMQLMDLCQFEGLANVSVRTRPDGGKR